jgi:glycosyltransferase involved in cell wall biosynthesis
MVNETQKNMISVVIPTYNEEGSIPHLINSLESVMRNVGRNYEIIFIDDGSTDNTFTILKDHRSRNPNIKIIKFRRNFGQSAALTAGFQHVKGDTIISMDADLQNDPADVPLLLDKLSRDYDAICGWRFNRADKASKKIFSKFANILRRALTGEEIHDSGCTLRAYKRQAISDMDLYGEMHRYIPAVMLWRGFKIGEVKVHHHARQYGRTKYNWRRIIRGFLDLIVISFWQKYSTKPIHIFGSLGIIMGFIGMILIGYLLIERILLNESLSGRPLFTMAVLMVIIGTQFIMSGLLADILIKIYYGQNERKNYLIELFEE